MRVEYHIPKEEKVKLFGEGIWTDEPDEAEWIHEESGLPCLIIRHQAYGTFSGYFGVPPENPLYKSDGDFLEEEITFTGLSLPEGIVRDARKTDPLTLPIQIEAAFLNYWFFGFDCAHAGDVIPMFRGRELAGILRRRQTQPLLIASRVGRGTWRGPDVYRDFAFVRKEVEHLAQQAHELHRGGRRTL
jgi:hypothetical protein